MKYLKDIDFKNKRVLLRVDFNTPLINGEIQDDWRIRLALPTIKYILDKPRTKLVIISHLGRPKGKTGKEFSLRPISNKLKLLLDKEILFIDNPGSEAADEKIRNLNDGEVALGENLRFHSEEEKNDEKFAIKLCHHFGVFVNDAFSASHRAHASVAQIPKFKPSCAGLLFQKEIEELGKALKPSRRPAIAIIGGAKIDTKLPVIEKLAQFYDAILIGGRIAVEARERNIVFSKNVIVAEDFSEGNFDIGPKTIEKYKMAISAASFIVWNGPMGKFEEERYGKGTREIYEAIISAEAHKIAGGGETVEYINSRKGSDKFDFVSSGGGAMLEFLSGTVLPGIEALEKSQ